MVGGGIAVGQVIAFAAMPFLTRLYGPTAFGIAAAFTAIVNIITPLATLGYANAIVMPDEENEAVEVARLAILCGLIMAPLSLIVVHFGKPWLASWTGMEQAPYMLYFIPLTLLIGAFLSVATQATIRVGLFKAKSRSYIESTIIKNISSLAGGMIAPSGFVLIVITLIGQLSNFILQMLHVTKIGVLDIKQWFGTRGTTKVAILYKDFAVYRMPQSVIYTMSSGMPVILLASLFGSEYAGQYSLAILILGAPVTLLGQAVGEVFYPKITRLINTRSADSYKFLFKVSLILLLLGLVPIIIIVIFGKALIALIFGEEWRLAGGYIQWLSVWLLTTLVADASVATLPALNLQKYLLFKEVISVSLRILAFYIGATIYKSDIIAIALFSVIGFVINILLVGLTLRYLNLKTKQWDLKDNNNNII